jgi:elongator complex protein 3
MKNYSFDYTKHLDQLLPLLHELESVDDLTPKTLSRIINKYPRDIKDIFSKDTIVQAYRQLAGSNGLKPFSEDFVRTIQMKPTRTISGVTPVTVLTKPFPCPGKCIFCPNDIRMPKSYLSDEPGAQRAERNSFDPYLQTYNRLKAFQNIGHRTDKVEIIVLGGTWSYYPESYQIWFIRECFRALNDFSQQEDHRVAVEKQYAQMREKLTEKHQFAASSDPKENQKNLEDQQIHGEELEKSYNQKVSELYVAPERKGGFDEYQSATWEELLEQQKINETAVCRNVGLVIETRPDNISEEEVLKIRRFGCTKTQIGFQSLQDAVLSVNKRGHDVAATRRAVNLLRQAGFKIHAHWMPNLYGSSVQLDKADYDILFNDPDFKPDELKIYPCSLIESAELMQYYKAGKWRPYTEAELLEVLTYCLTHTPEYCRLTRVIRDIPSTDIVVGNKKTNFREIAEKKLTEFGERSQDIRAREVRTQQVTREELTLDEVAYETTVSTEVFLQFITAERKIAGFLRLSLPKIQNFVAELRDCAIVREVHVYGQAVGLGNRDEGKAQHLGLGTELIERAKAIAIQKKFNTLAVISAIGTREYYRKRGFVDGELYQRCALTKTATN